MKLIPSVPKSSLTSSCNINCGCSTSRFAPVCGSDHVTYFDKCHAGCSTQLPNAVMMVYVLFIPCFKYSIMFNFSFA